MDKRDWAGTVLVACLIAVAGLLHDHTLLLVILAVVAGVCAVVIAWDVRANSARLQVSLPLVDRLRPALSEGVVLVARLDPACPVLDVLRPARAWQREAYVMLAGERRDLAQRFLDAAPPVEERETQSSATINPARLIIEEQTSVLREIIDQLELDQ